MAGEWETLPLEDCMAAIIDYRGKSPEKTTFGVPLVTAKIVKGGRIEKPEEFIAEADFDDWMRRGMPKPGDIVMTTEAPLGEVAQLDGRKVALAQRVITLRGKPDVLDNTFLKFLLQSNPVQEELRSRGTGTTVVGIRQSELRKVSLTLPPLAEQKAIAAVLGALDDKIELNRRMNATLEAMARALFQSWFIDFDPVRANLDRNQPSPAASRHPLPLGEGRGEGRFALDPAPAALFPEHLEDSPLGHIPKGWEVKTVGDIGDVICGKTPPTSVADYYGEDIPFITIPDMHGNVFGAATARKLSHSGANSQANKTLPPGSLCVSCIATPGLVVITSENSQTNQQINSVVPHEKEETYFWYWVMTGLGAEIASSGSGGSVLVNLSKGRFETLQVIKPPHTLIRAYHNAVRPLFETILANTHQSRTLATLRDTLLPKLLSGELGVQGAIN